MVESDMASHGSESAATFEEALEIARNYVELICKRLMRLTMNHGTGG
jgi:hypothetical protein